MSFMDAQEVKASDNATPLEALIYPLTKTQGRNYTGLGIDGMPICMFGTHPSEMEGYGVIWFLGSDELKKHKYLVVKMCLEIIPELTKGYKVLYNFVDARHTQARKWLKLLGFQETYKVQSWGYSQIPFILMTYEVNKQCAE